MELFMPSKENWEEMQKNISSIVSDMQQFNHYLKNGGLATEHFPDFMDIPTAARYLKCPVSRIKSMIYTQKLLPVHHIDLTTTVYVSKQEMNELKFKVLSIKRLKKGG